MADPLAASVSVYSERRPLLMTEFVDGKHAPVTPPHVRRAWRAARRALGVPGH